MHSIWWQPMGRWLVVTSCSLPLFVPSYLSLHSPPNLFSSAFSKLSIQIASSFKLYSMAKMQLFICGGNVFIIINVFFSTSLLLYEVFPNSDWQAHPTLPHGTLKWSGCRGIWRGSLFEPIFSAPFRLQFKDRLINRARDSLTVEIFCLSS